jgi:hypothetical protein
MSIQYSIGITTFSKRFNMCENLVKKIKQYRPDVPILLAVNANFKTGFDEEYRKQILQLVQSQPRVYPILFPEMRGYAKMLNTLVVHSPTEHLLLMSDDMDIKEDFAFDNFEQQLQNTTFPIWKVQYDFSQVLFTKKGMIDIGWMDERYLSFGHEDGDLYYRYIEKYGHEIPMRDVAGFVHFNSDVLDDNFDNDTQSGNVRYSLFNHNFLKNEKYFPDNERGLQRTSFGVPMIKVLEDKQQYVYEQFYLNNRDKL